MDEEHFTQALGWIFEDSPWVAGRTWPRRPFDSIDALHAAMLRTVELATDEERVALLRAHPELGSRARISDASCGEQRAAGLDQDTEQLERLNARYKERFGFPFIFAVKGSTKHDILRDLERRLTETQEAEERCALQHVYRIARFRLEDTVQQGE